MGIVYEGDYRDSSVSTKQIRTVKFGEEVRKYEIMHILDFDSDRKRMSIILKSLETNEIILMTKGAENAVFAKCKDGNIEDCNQNISDFAVKGWRTLAMGYRKLSVQNLDLYDELLNDAYNDLTNREEKLKQVFDQIESNLILIGATAVEDRLQDDVAATLTSLRMAGIKIWVLTGDKKETAINISESCRHFSPDMHRMVLTNEKDDIRIVDQLKGFIK